ncbi:hypothetical protein [Natronorubrum thiooxidans]|uniref:Uncharacterized protein n=1 Tax=Natronorubrum thiooxidans TaxID=308853 RepID=A0A1N7GT80_9EURY|nr:hypothetical protein [Natronorubrum thiooxidans]SIS15803.1 hypothetical protein SAMN05421752_11543 [Natronorubrum thiooxidans]
MFDPFDPIDFDFQEFNPLKDSHDQRLQNEFRMASDEDLLLVKERLKMDPSINRTTRSTLKDMIRDEKKRRHSVDPDPVAGSGKNKNYSSSSDEGGSSSKADQEPEYVEGYQESYISDYQE